MVKSYNYDEYVDAFEIAYPLNVPVYAKETWDRQSASYRTRIMKELVKVVETRFNPDQQADTPDTQVIAW